MTDDLRLTGDLVARSSFFLFARRASRQFHVSPLPVAIFFRASAANVEQTAKARPVEGSARIGLAPWRDVGMPGDIRDRVARGERASQRGEARVLRVGVRHLTGALEFDADGKVVAAYPPLPDRLAGVPRTLGARDELDQLAVATDEEMSGNLRAGNGREVRMGRGIEPVGEEIDNTVPAELTRRQADVMNDEEVDG